MPSRRTTGAVVAVVLVAALIAGGFVAVGLRRREADRRRLRTESGFRKDAEAVERLMTRIDRERPGKGALHAELLEAEGSCRRGLAIMDELAARMPDDLGYRRERAAILEMLGDLLAALDRSDEAESAYREATTAFTSVLVEEPGSIEDLWRASVGFDHLGVLLHRAGRWDEAEHFFLRGRNLCEAAPASRPVDTRVRRERAAVLCHLGRFLMDRGRRGEALQGFAQAVEVQKALIDDATQTDDDRERLVTLFIDQARALTADGQASAAERTLVEARALALRLRDDRPAVVRYHELTASVLNDLAGVIRCDPSRLDEAREILGRAIAIQDGLVAMSPAVPEYRSKLASMCGGLADRLRTRHAFDEAESVYRKVRSLQSRLAAEHPQVTAYQFGHGRSLHNLADLLRERGRPEEGLPLEREAVRLLGDLYRSHCKDPDYRRAFSFAGWTLSAILVDRKDHRAAARAVSEYLRIEPNGFEESLEAAGFLCRCARICRDDTAASLPERESLARTYADRALDALRIAVRNGFRDAKVLQMAAYQPLQDREDFRRLIRQIESMTGTLDESP